MFELIAKSTIEITELEIDVRWDLISKNSVEVDVHVFEGGNYDMAANDASQWEMVAQTTARRQGETSSALLQNMSPIQIEKGRRVAIYIALRNEPTAVLDYTAYALDKTGEEADANSDIQLLVGLGFVRGPSFATPADKVLDPQFAGVLHYSKPIRCAVLSSHTVAQFIFLLEQEDVSTLNSALAVAVANACEKLVDSYPMLQQWEKEFILQQSHSVPDVTVMAYACTYYESCCIL